MSISHDEPIESNGGQITDCHLCKEEEGGGGEGRGRRRRGRGRMRRTVLDDSEILYSRLVSTFLLNPIQVRAAFKGRLCSPKLL